MLLASPMAVTKKKKKGYTGHNIRISDKAFERIKSYVDEKGLKLGRFVEDSTLKILNQNTNGKD